jgi:GR25 family glycosyltransferase involved in LPS biosynthesis
MNNPIPVLIIAYRRKDSLREILRLCEANSVNRIYVAIDGPKNNSVAGKRDNSEMNKLVSDFSKQFSGRVFLLNRSKNIGCAASVLSACDWIFEKESAAIILEDDCIPTSDFFRFSQLAVEVINKDERIWLSCGTQFMPEDNRMDSWFLSRYPLTWGWSTTRKKWLEISAELKMNKTLKAADVSKAETIYWNAGARRAQRGWVDVWDTVLAQRLIALNKLVILPKCCLISNVGNDSFATNTTDPSKWVETKIGNFMAPKNFPIPEPKIDLWLRVEFFKISKRHLITTKITWIKDLLMYFGKPYRPLTKRWSMAKWHR